MSIADLIARKKAQAAKADRVHIGTHPTHGKARVNPPFEDGSGCFDCRGAQPATTTYRRGVIAYRLCEDCYEGRETK